MKLGIVGRLFPLMFSKVVYGYKSTGKNTKRW